MKMNVDPEGNKPYPEMSLVKDVDAPGESRVVCGEEKSGE
jgi:hypothetical protein